VLLSDWHLLQNSWYLTCHLGIHKLQFNTVELEPQQGCQKV